MSFLRDYQIAAQQSVMTELEDHESTLVVLPTGCGKTEVGLSIMDDWPGDGHKLWLAHREELVWQPWERWHRKTGEYAEMEMAEYGRSRSGSRVTFASKDSLWREKRLRCAFPDPKEVDLIFVDEAHHAVKQNKSYQAILDYFSGNPNLKVIGLTATPDRADEQALGQTFDSVAYDFPLYSPHGEPSAITDGWLVPIEQQFITVEDVDFDAVGIRGGDFIDSQLAEQMLKEKAMLGQCSAGMSLAGDATTLVFAASISQAVKQAEIFNRHKPDSAWAIASRVDDDMAFDFVMQSNDKQARRRLLKRWGRGEFQFFCNVGVFTEGMDEPAIRAILMGRPTKSRALYSQMAGRGTRVLPNIIEGRTEQGGYWRLETAAERKAAIAGSGKTSVLLVDFVGNSRHSLISSIDIMGGTFPDEVVARATKKLTDAGDSQNVLEALEEAQSELEAEAKEKRRRDLEARKRLRATAAYRCREVDPFGVLGVIPPREPGWHHGRKPSDRQKAALQRFKVDDVVIERLSFWQASKMLDNLVSRCKEGKATYKQCAILAKFGEDGAEMKFDEASRTIDLIAKNGWKALTT